MFLSLIGLKDHHIFFHIFITIRWQAYGPPKRILYILWTPATPGASLGSNTAEKILL